MNDYLAQARHALDRRTPASVPATTSAGGTSPHTDGAYGINGNNGISTHPAGSREAPPYACWKPGCHGTAVGLWQRVGPDAWQAACSGGHVIQRSALSFELEGRAR